MMDDTRYIQTFYYCRACGAQVRAYYWYHKWAGRVRFFFGGLSFFALIFLCVLLGEVFKQNRNNKPLPPDLMMLWFPAVLVRSRRCSSPGGGCAVG